MAASACFLRCAALAACLVHSALTQAPAPYDAPGAVAPFMDPASVPATPESERLVDEGDQATQAATPAEATSAEASLAEAAPAATPAAMIPASASPATAAPTLQTPPPFVEPSQMDPARLASAQGTPAAAPVPAPAPGSGTLVADLDQRSKRADIRVNWSVQQGDFISLCGLQDITTDCQQVNVTYVFLNMSMDSGLTTFSVRFWPPPAYSIKKGNAVYKSTELPAWQQTSCSDVDYSLFGKASAAPRQTVDCQDLVRSTISLFKLSKLSFSSFDGLAISLCLVASLAFVVSFLAVRIRHSVQSLRPSDDYLHVRSEEPHGLLGTEESHELLGTEESHRLLG
eukprot:TRINITY_DN4340_c0_g1_i1.p1 TRINITY_DN4340_c0_g1~~TRINITY_DN4340_c0_g1_i1.p1  ORF type:complete len:342 (-),score=41.74 TRINITY_DN4340_c0_g1_i1:80-1105(-)